MKIGIISPKELLPDILDFISREFPEIEAVPFPYTLISDIPEILSGRQNRADAFLFLGETARRYTEKILPASSQWLAIPRSSAAFLRLLFLAAMAGHAMRLATDWPNEDLFRRAFREVGLAENAYTVEALPLATYNEEQLMQNAERMEKLYRAGKIDFCITIFYKVLELLKAKNVPCYILQPSLEDIQNGLSRLILSRELALSRNSRLAAVSVRIDTPVKALPGRNSYDIAMETLQTARHIYRFARDMQAACIERTRTEYLLFTTRAHVENMTDHYRRLPLLAAVRDDTPFTLSVGFGYGAAADEAELHAEKAMERASSGGGDQAFIIGTDFSSPIPMTKNEQNAGEETSPIDERFFRLSKETGISMRILTYLHRACRETGKRRFTSAELSDLIGVTPRTMNRILLKLITHKLARETGRQFTAQTGRPSRIIELCIDP